MCVIAAKPKDIIIPSDVLKRCFESNPDGAGFAVNLGRRRGGLIAKKGFFSFEEFLDAYRPYEKEAAVIHFRIKTHGEKNADMCHPFQVSEDLWVVHNGIINIDTSDDATKSDTWHFVEKVLKPELEVDPTALKRSSFRYMLGQCIDRSKLAFLDSRSQINIINKTLGETHEGVWYSNASYKEHRGFFSADPRYSAGWGTGCYGGYNTIPSGAKSANPDLSKVTKITDIPATYNWAIACLRKDGQMTDEQIVASFAKGSYEDDIFDIYEAMRSAERYHFEEGAETPVRVLEGA